MRWFALLTALLAACSEDAGKAVPQQSAPQAPIVLEHDFGIIPHGEAREHEFPIDLSKLGEPWVPLRVHIDCSCGHADLRLRHRDGRERFVDASGNASNMPGPDETLVLTVRIDTATKEALDLPHTQSRGFVMLQLASDMTGNSRIQWPLLVRFGVEAPVVLRPLATLDFGRVPLSGRGLVVTTMRGDEAHALATFGPVASSDPDVAVELVKEPDHWLLRATCTPKELGNHRGVVTVQNSIPGYRLELATTWKVIPDLEATPMAKISFRTPLQQAQTAGEVIGQFVVLTDHDVRRSAEFAVQRCVDEAGRDLTANFAITFEPLSNSPRQHRMQVRYTGGLTEGVRASIVLTKDGERGPFLPIELVVFAKQ